ncbi:tRNA-binding protein [Halobacteriovorax sp. GFR7]|uniref:tRNA-binding protein n=1 Tax=unclassified Halobacteriovorax TaxID=2639665 RepID=UPI003D98BAA6
MHIDFSATAPAQENIDFSKFLEVDMRIGEVVEVQDFPEARKPSYKLKINFGEGIGVKKSSAQITVHYKKEDLIGKKVLAVVNFPPRQIGKFMSEVLVMGFSDSNNDIVLFNLDRDVPNGARLH